MTLENILQSIASWINQQDKKIVIGISGHGASGKTTFSDSLIDLLTNPKISYLNTDPYIVTSGVRKYSVINYLSDKKTHTYKMTACHPNAHHISALERDINMLKSGMDLQTIDVPYLRSKLLSARNALTIVEGMSVAFADQELFDLSIYLYTDGQTEFTRRSQRDISERGSTLENLLHSHEERRIQYEVFMHPYSKYFDIVINSSTDKVIIEKNLLSSV